VLNEILYLKELVEKKAVHSKHDLPPLFELTSLYLLKKEIDEQLDDTITSEATKNSDVNAITYKKDMIGALKYLLDNKLENAIGGTFDDHKQIIQFVGPTGVGKTTTLAKVAAKTILEQKKEVAFITMDTYRIAAIDQLKTYARILDVPIEVAYSLDD